MNQARRRPDPVLLTAVVLLAAAAIFAAVAGWARAGAPRVPATAQVRDQALQAGEQAVLNFNTLDYRSVGAGLKLWEQSSTGSLREGVVAGSAAFEKQIRQAKTITTARILDGALTSLNADAGNAAIIVAIQLTVTPDHGTPVVKQSRLEGELTRTRSGWKLSSLTQAPVQAAS
jgi:Mce-associated membrane protein